MISDKNGISDEKKFEHIKNFVQLYQTQHVSMFAELRKLIKQASKTNDSIKTTTNALTVGINATQDVFGTFAEIVNNANTYDEIKTALEEFDTWNSGSSAPSAKTRITTAQTLFEVAQKSLTGALEYADLTEHPSIPPASNMPLLQDLSDKVEALHKGLFKNNTALAYVEPLLENIIFPNITEKTRMHRTIIGDILHNAARDGGSVLSPGR